MNEFYWVIQYPNGSFKRHARSFSMPAIYKSLGIAKSVATQTHIPHENIKKVKIVVIEEH